MFFCCPQIFLSKNKKIHGKQNIFLKKTKGLPWKIVFFKKWQG